MLGTNVETNRPAFVDAPPSADGEHPWRSGGAASTPAAAAAGHDFPQVLVTRPCGHHRQTGQCEAWSIWQFTSAVSFRRCRRSPGFRADAVPGWHTCQHSLDIYGRVEILQMRR